MKIITGRRGVLRTFALTMATSAIGVASAGVKPAAAAVESALMPPGELCHDVPCFVVFCPDRPLCVPKTVNPTIVVMKSAQDGA
jgi:hypothetical protein